MLHIHIVPYDHNKFLIPKARPTSIKVCGNLFSWKSPPFPIGERLSLTVCVKKYCPVCWYSDSSLFLPSVSLCCLRNPKDRKIQLLKTPCTRHRKQTNLCDPDLEDSSLLASFYDARRFKGVKVKMVFRNYKPMRTRKGNWFLQRYAFWWIALYPYDSVVWGKKDMKLGQWPTDAFPGANTCVNKATTQACLTAVWLLVKSTFELFQYTYACVF